MKYAKVHRRTSATSWRKHAASTIRWVEKGWFDSIGTLVHADNVQEASRPTSTFSRSVLHWSWWGLCSWSDLQPCFQMKTFAWALPLPTTRYWTCSLQRPSSFPLLLNFFMADRQMSLPKFRIISLRSCHFSMRMSKTIQGCVSWYIICVACICRKPRFFNWIVFSSDAIRFFVAPVHGEVTKHCWRVWKHCRIV